MSKIGGMPDRIPADVAMLKCELRKSGCDGSDLRPVMLRLPMRVNRFETKPKLACAVCRRTLKGGWRYDRDYLGRSLV